MKSQLSIHCPQNRSESKWMKCSFAEKGPGVLVDKFAKSQQCAPATNEGNLILGCATKTAHVRESNCFHLLAL